MAKQSYMIISFSLYPEDSQLLNELVKSFKARGYTGTSRSDVVRYAIRNLNPAKVLPVGFGRLAPQAGGKR